MAPAPSKPMFDENNGKQENVAEDVGTDKYEDQQEPHRLEPMADHGNGGKGDDEVMSDEENIGDDDNEISQPNVDGDEDAEDSTSDAEKIIELCEYYKDFLVGFRHFQQYEPED
jgi:hypothetical protein